MSSVIHADVSSDLSGNQITLERDSWFSHEAAQWIDEALENPKIGPDKVLSIILHHGLGFSLETVARLQNTTKNVVTKRVITGTKRLRGKEPWRLRGKAQETNPELPVREWLESLCQHIGDLEESTRWAYGAVKRDIIAVFGEKSMGDVTPEDMFAFRDSLVARGLAPKTVKGRLSTARAIFRDAVRMGCLEKNPFEKQPYPKRSTPLPVLA